MDKEKIELIEKYASEWIADNLFFDEEMESKLTIEDLRFIVNAKFIVKVVVE